METVNEHLLTKRWEQVETIAKIASSVAIPIAIAVGGWLVQNGLSQNSARQEYVKIAVAILSAPNQPQGAPLREWAVQLLNRYSPLKLDSTTQQALAAGRIELPATLPFALSSQDKYFSNRVLNSTATLTFPKTSPGQSSTLTVTVSGSRMGDPIVVSYSAEAVVEGGVYTSYVQADDTVAVVFTNIRTSGDLAPRASTFRVINLAGLIK